MPQIENRQELVDAVTFAKALLNTANIALYKFDALPENNVFATLLDAQYELEDVLRDEARDDCEGAGNCGCDQYTKQFMVDGIVYLATLDVEYNRHDKQYYYIDGSKFSYTVFVS